MSKIGKLPVLVPNGVEVQITPTQAVVKGPKGSVTLAVPRGISVSLSEGKIKVACERSDRNTRCCFGTVRSLLANAVKGVVNEWEKQLEVIGTGYRVSVEGDSLVLVVGFSHPVKIQIEPGLVVSAADNKITVKGADRQQVGAFAATVRHVNPPNPYKGKGIRYAGEEIKLKPGKMAKTTTA